MTKIDEQRILDLAAQAFVKAQKRSRNDVGRGHPALGRVLSDAIESRGITQNELAESIGRHPTFLGKIVSGERGMSIETLARIDAFLGKDFTHEYLSTMLAVQSGEIDE